MGAITAVQVATPNCAATIGRTGDGVYNGRRKTGIVIGAIIGGGLAHALGGDAGQVVTGVLGGAQTGTYIGSTFDQDAQLRDQIDLNRSRCGAGTYYNTVSHQCEQRLAMYPKRNLLMSLVSKASVRSKRRTTTALRFRLGGRFDAEAGACVAPRPVLSRSHKPLQPKSPPHSSANNKRSKKVA
jgi:uncharacterized protein YcfJ